MDYTALKQLYPKLVTGYEVYNEILKEYHFIFNNDLFDSNLDSKLLNFLVHRQFVADMLPDNFCFEVDILKVNAFGYKAVLLSKKDIIINLAKAYKETSIPNPKAKYRLELAQNNRRYHKQLQLDIVENNIQIGEEKIFGLLTYNFNKYGIKFINFGIPKDNLGYYIRNINLIKKYENNNRLLLVESEKEVKKVKVKLKEEFKKEFKIK
jgi:hypothetical protein